MNDPVISADCHIDLIWLPPDLFTDNASAAMRDRMPYVTRSEEGPLWVSRKGARFGLQNGMGSAGRLYVPGVIHRADRMAQTGLYEDGKKGIRRLTDPDLRIRDQDLDGVRGEVLYGILGASQRLEDPEAATEVMRIYNDWLADFCATHPNRFAGIASIPNHDMDAAVAEVRRVAERGAVRGIEVALTTDMKPLFDPHWEPLWRAASETGLPVHFHTIGGKKLDTSGMAELQARQAFACHITHFQLNMATKLMEIIYGGALEAFPEMRVVIGESGIGWIPYVLDHMDLEWEDQFKDLTLTMKPSRYWHRQCFATYQSDPVGIRLLDLLGEDNVMWGSDFPHPDGVWPDSREFLQRETSGLPDATRRKLVAGNAARLYGFDLPDSGRSAA
jgi:predicted TIM-barrel fold metal-dependent hydrolase